MYDCKHYIHILIIVQNFKDTSVKFMVDTLDFEKLYADISQIYHDTHKFTFQKNIRYLNRHQITNTINVHFINFL